MLSESATCPPWCREHEDSDESGSRRHMTPERKFRGIDKVSVCVGLEWDMIDTDEPVINLDCLNDGYFTPSQAAALGTELLRLSGLAHTTEERG
jgi:hypothetical protein